MNVQDTHAIGVSNMNTLTAGLWGALAASSLLIGAALAIWLRPSYRIIGLIMGFGSGALISAIAYELVPEAAKGDFPVVLGLAAGALTFFLADRVVDRHGGESRKSIETKQQANAGLAIFLGTLLDGIPESLVLGMSLARGGSVGVAFLVAVFVSNLPESMASTTSMEDSGMPRKTILGMWLALLVASALAAALGYVLITRESGAEGAGVQAFAAGAMLTMLADSMMPEAFEHGGKAVGLITVCGFVVATALAFM
jgi:ZIP family zinc transporter